MSAKAKEEWQRGNRDYVRCTVDARRFRRRVVGKFPAVEIDLGPQGRDPSRIYGIRFYEYHLDLRLDRSPLRTTDLLLGAVLLRHQAAE